MYLLRHQKYISVITIKLTVFHRVTILGEKNEIQSGLFKFGGDQKKLYHNILFV